MDLQIRLGRRLPHRSANETRETGRTAGGRSRRCFSHMCRHGSTARTILGPKSRLGLDRKKHLPDQPKFRIVVLPGRTPNHSTNRSQSSTSSRPLWNLHPLYRCLPHPSPNPIRTGCKPVHLLLHNRVTLCNPGYKTKPFGLAHLRLRHLSGRLPVEPPSPAIDRIPTRPIRTAIRTNGRVNRITIQSHVQPHPGKPGKIQWLPEKHSDSNGELRPKEVRRTVNQTGKL